MIFENNIISQLDTPVISQCLQGAEQLTCFFMLPWHEIYSALWWLLICVNLAGSQCPSVAKHYSRWFCEVFGDKNNIQISEFWMKLPLQQAHGPHLISSRPEYTKTLIFPEQERILWQTPFRFEIPALDFPVSSAWWLDLNYNNNSFLNLHPIEFVLASLHNIMSSLLKINAILLIRTHAIGSVSLEYPD